MYIHCLNHALALVFKDTLSKVKVVEDFFELVQNLYVFFRIPQIQRFYSGKSLKKLIDTRWSGHLYCLVAMKESHEEIRQTLKSCKDSKKVDAKHRAQAIGYLSQFEDPMNRFLVIFMEAVALQLNILTETFQKVDCNISTALQTLKSVRKKVNALRAHYTSDKIGALLRADKVEEPLALGKRKRVVSTRFKDSIVTEKLPINRNSPNSRSFTSMRSVVTEVIDTLNSELDERFQQADTALWKAFEHLNPASDSFLDAGELAPLRPPGPRWGLRPQTPPVTRPHWPPLENTWPPPG